MSMMNKVALPLVLASLICAGCASTGGGAYENEPPMTDAPPTPPAEEAAAPAEETSKQEEGEVPLAVAETEHPTERANETREGIVVKGRALGRHEIIHDLVTEAQTLLRDV